MTEPTEKQQEHSREGQAEAAPPKKARRWAAPGPSRLRTLALVGVFATVVGRALAPALHGARSGIDGLITATEFIGAFATYVFAFGALAETIAGIHKTLRHNRLGSTYRLASAGLAAVIVLLMAPALHRPLGEEGSIALGAAASSLAILAMGPALRVPRTRAVGIVLGTMGLAGLAHGFAAALAFYAGDRAILSLAQAARAVATLGFVLDGLGLLLAASWLSLRDRTVSPWTTRLALFVAMAITYGAVAGMRDGAPLWQVLSYRSASRMLVAPIPWVWPPLRYLVEVTAPLLALVAATTRRHAPSIVASLALVLLARSHADIPFCALSLALASLTLPLTSLDDRSMWVVVDGRLQPMA